jgi:hypothetical protein
MTICGTALCTEIVISAVPLKVSSFRSVRMVKS